jgi:hypothetical protein
MRGVLSAIPSLEIKPRSAMVGKGTQYQSPMILQLVNNCEEQLTAGSQNFEESDHGLRFFTSQPTKMVDFGQVIEWVRVFFQVFWLALLSGSFLLVWIFALKLAGY